MPPIVAALVGAITRFNHLAFNFAALMVFAIVPAMLIDVVMRYVFNAPTVWAMELATLLFGPYFLLAGPYVLHLKGHVAMDLLRKHLSLSGDRLMELVNLPMIVAFCGILLWFSVPAAIDSWNYGETSFSAWNPPIWWTKAAVPLGLMMMLAQAVAEFLRTFYATGSEAK